MTTTSTDQPTTAQIDEAAVEEFAGRMFDIVSGASTALMTSVGHQVGLFDTLGVLEPSTSEQIADAAELSERYVREWLGAMTVAGIVTHDPGTDRYSLPAEHAAVLTRAAGPNNLASLTQFIPLLAHVESQIVDCFHHGGGVPYTAFERFHALMAEQSAQTNDAALVDGIIPLVDGLPERLKAGIRVADIGCGQGHAANLLAQAFPNSTFVGYDFSEEAIETGRAEAAELGLTNASFEVRDVTDLSDTGTFDLITAFDAIHDQAHPADVLNQCASHLAPDGDFLMVDIKASSSVDNNVEIPWAPFLYTVSTMHCMTVSLALDGDGLGTVWGEELAVKMLDGAGFSHVEVKSVDDDPINSYYVARR